MEVVFSIIIPSYNRGSIISQSIGSVVKQSYKNWEIIVVDDGSTDNTGEIVGGLTTDNRIKYFKKENEGVSAARNYGAGKASGSYFLFLDSDDMLATNCLESVGNAISESVQLIKGAVAFVSDKGTRIEYATRKHKLFNGHTTLFLAGSFCIHRELFSKVGGYDQRLNFGENTELSIRVYQQNPKEVVLESVFFYYAMANDNDNRNIRNKILSHIYILKKHKQLYQSKNLYSRQHYLIAKRLFNLNKNYFGMRLLRKAYSLDPLNLYPVLFYIKRKLVKRT